MKSNLKMEKSLHTKDKKVEDLENDLLGHKLNRVEFLNGVYCINGDRSLFLEAKTREVIGNIFDNQEMLEAEQ